MTYDNVLLETLGIQGDLLNTFNCLSEDEKKKCLRTQYYKLSQQYHPDKNKNPDDTEVFLKIKDAYTRLCDGTATPKIGIEEYFVSKPLDFSNTDFDLLLTEEIHLTFEALKRQFNQLETEEDKRQFAGYYADFFNLAQAIDNNRERLSQVRDSYFLKLQDKTLKDNLRENYLELVICLFGEEYLDDFQYREALATGNLYPILATRKLLSPVKWLAGLACSILLFITTTTHYYVQEFMMKNLMPELFALIESNKEGNINYQLLASFLIKTSILIAAPIWLYLYHFTAIALLSSIPLLLHVSKTLACPVNNLSRPIANSLQVNPLLVTAALTLTVAAIPYVLLPLLLSSNILVVIPWITLTINIYTWYKEYQLYKTIEKLSPTLANLLIPFFISDIITDYIANMGNLNPSYGQQILAFLGSLSDLGTIYTAGNITELVSQNMDYLPPAEETVSDRVKKATLSGHKKALHSHRFFNTDPDAAWLKNEDRTIWQQCCSFFGGGMKLAQHDFIATRKQPQRLMLEQAEPQCM